MLFRSDKFEAIGGEGAFQVLQVTEQQIMDSMIQANRNGHIACTQGGESFAGAKRAKELGLVTDEELCILDSTAHQLKFVEFQNMYFENSFEPEFEVSPNMDLANKPSLVISPEEKEKLSDEEYTRTTADKVVAKLGLEKK